MALTSKLGRPLLAAIFISGGIDNLRNTREKAKEYGPVVDDLARPLGLPEDPEKLVRINGGVQVVAGSLMALGKLPRVSALVLAGSLVPTTYAENRFWDEHDPERRGQQKRQFLKNVAMVGGLVIASGDTEGRPSMGWRARRALKRSKPAAERMADVVADDAVPALTDAVGSVGRAVSDSAREAGPLIRRFTAAAMEAADTARDSARDFAEAAAPVIRERASQAREHAEELAESARPVLREKTEHARERVEELADVARPVVRERADKVRAHAEDMADAARPVVHERAVQARQLADVARPVLREKTEQARHAGKAALEAARA